MIDQHYPLPFDVVSVSAVPSYDFNWAVSMLAENDTDLWVGAVKKLFHYSDGGLRVLDSRNGLPPSRIRTIGRDGYGDLWIGTESDSACRLVENRFTCFTTTNGLSSNNVSQIFVDREKTLWLATDNAGLNRVTRQTIASFSKDAGLSATNVYPIMQDRSGAIWIGAFGALTRSAEGKTTNYLREDGLIFDHVQALLEDREGSLWIGSVGGLTRFRNGKFEDFTEVLGFVKGRENFWAIHQTPDGAIWVGTDNGLCRYFEDKVTNFSIDDGLPGKEVKVIHESRDGSLWIGTIAGLAILRDGKLTPLTEKDGLAGNFVRTIYEDDAGLWIGTYDSGMSLFRDGRFARRITAENGLFSNGVFAILPDDQGNFWMSSNQGIYRVSRQELIDFADEKIGSVTSVAFGKSDGMLSTECNGGRQPAGIRAKDGRLWFPTQNGVAIVDPNAIPHNPLAPSLVIEDVMIQQKAVGQSPELITVQPGEGDLQLNYTGLSFIKPEQMRFRYRLEGLDDGWTDAGNRRTAFYPYLPPGDYVFRVTAANSDGVWNLEGQSLTVRVLPPFYRTFWFNVLVAAAVALIVFLLYRRRIAVLERRREEQQAFALQLIASQEHERKRIAAELHDSLGQRLVVIKNLALMFLNPGKLEPDPGKVESISSEASDAIDEVNQISNNLRPYQLDRIGLTKAVEALVRSARKASVINFSSEIDDLDSFFPKDLEINFYRIVQECVNNVIKHSQAIDATVTVKRSDSAVELRVSDDGVGFTPFRTESKTGGFGLIGLVERVQLFGGKMDIDSSPGHGTDVRVVLNKK